MLPSWRDQIDVFFAPGRIDAVQTKRGLKPATLPVTTQFIPDDQMAEQPSWLLPMQQLESLLAETTGAGMTVTLSNHFVRYITLLPQAEITSPEEVMAYADFRMREIYGTRVDQWVLSISAWSPLHGAICAAISKEFLVQLEEVVSRHQIKLNGVEPYLTAVLDRWANALNQEKSFVAMVEAGRICVALLEDGVWRNIRNQRILNDAGNELWAVLDQEAVLSGHKETIEQLFLFAPEHPELVLPDESGWQSVPLQTDQIPVPLHYPVAAAETVQSEEYGCPV